MKNSSFNTTTTVWLIHFRMPLFDSFHIVVGFYLLFKAEGRLLTLEQDQLSLCEQATRMGRERLIGTQILSALYPANPLTLIPRASEYCCFSL